MSLVDLARDALRDELHRHGLLLADADTPVAVPELLPRALAVCFPEFDFTGQHVDVVFESAEERTRVEQALLFGWVTADVLRAASDERSHLLCALFNLGIGMIDGVCDTNPGQGAVLLDCVQSLNVESAASGQWRQGQMLESLPVDAAADPTIAFTARIIDAFFALLHATHDASLRKQVGRLLADALTAEQRSVARSPAAPAELMEASRGTSVLPFLVMATLARGDLDAATHLGDAMWRIDDLIDLELDDESGALNSLLLDGAPERARIHAVAREAVDHLRAGLGVADKRNFLSFVQRYAQIRSEESTPY